jgi:UDP-2-acetamido-3-amino-2,3-dideoxy-glucuronate N-acetyltransferase
MTTNDAIHPSAIVDAGAVLGDGTHVWHFSHVCAGARIGAACSLGQNVFVGNDVVIGDRVKIQNNVSVYDAVTLEDEVFCGPSMVFTNVYNPRAGFVRKNQYRRTLVRRGASIGANATIVCGVTVGAWAFIGAGAVVKHDVPDFALMAGVPAASASACPCRAPATAKPAARIPATATCCRTVSAASCPPPINAIRFTPGPPWNSSISSPSTRPRAT